MRGASSIRRPRNSWNKGNAIKKTTCFAFFVRFVRIICSPKIQLHGLIAVENQLRVCVRDERSQAVSMQVSLDLVAQHAFSVCTLSGGEIRRSVKANSQAATPLKFAWGALTWFTNVTSVARTDLPGSALPLASAHIRTRVRLPSRIDAGSDSSG